MDPTTSTSNSVNGSQYPQVIKKRKRVTHTCSSCRARKIKCDQGRPCSACIKKKIPASLCIYEDSSLLLPEAVRDPEQAVLVLTEENKRLKAQIDHMKKEALLKGSPKAKTQFEDPILRKTVIRHENLTIKKNRIMFNGPTNWRGLWDKNEEHKEIIDAAKRFVANAKKEWRNEGEIKKVTCEEYRHIEGGTPQLLLEDLSAYLPDYYTVKEYLTVYTNSYTYAMLPVIDKDMLMEDFHEIFEKEFSSFNKIKFNIKNKTVDYAKIALIILCIKSTVTIKNLAITESEGKKNLYDQNDSLIRFAERLLDFSKYIVKANIPALQSLFLLFHLKRTCPLGSDAAGDGGNSVMIFKTAFDMALIMGLNRNIPVLYADWPPRVIELLKNIWVLFLSTDSCISFAQGIPLGISDEFIDFSYLDLDLPVVQHLIRLRNASKLLNCTESCTIGEVMEVINSLQELEKDQRLSDIVGTLRTADDFVNGFATADYIELRLLVAFVLHVLYEMLYLTFESHDPAREEFYNGSMKYGSLLVIHTIEVLSRLNIKLLATEENLPPEKYREKLFKIIEISTSLTSLSRIAFLKTFVSLCYEVLERIKVNSTVGKPEFDTQSKLRIDEFEDFDIKLNTSSIALAVRSPSVLHALLGLVCKRLLYLHNNSFGKVFAFNFCLYAVIALFKYFNNLLTKLLSKDQLEATINPEPPVTFQEDTDDSCDEGMSVNSIQNLSLQNQLNNDKIVNNDCSNRKGQEEAASSFQNPNYNNGLLNLSNIPNFAYQGNTVSLPQRSSTHSLAGSTPMSATAQSTPPESLNSYASDLLGWTNKPVEDLFQNILMNDALFTMDSNSSESFNWLNANEIPNADGVQLKSSIPHEERPPQNTKPKRNPYI